MIEEGDLRREREGEDGGVEEGKKGQASVV